MMGGDDKANQNIKFLTNLIKENTSYEDAEYYTLSFINTMSTDGQAEDDYSPVTREKIQNPNEEEVSSPLGNVLMHRKRRAEDQRESTKPMEGFKMMSEDA